MRADHPSRDIDGIFTSQEPLRFAVRPSVEAVGLEVVIEPVDGAGPQKVVSVAPSDEPWIRPEVSPLPPGVYRTTVRGDRRKLSL